MNPLQILKRGGAILAAVPVLTIAGLISTAAPPASDVAFKDGQLIRPENYREWVYVGTPLTPNDMNDGEAPFPEFHSVYINRQGWDAYKKSGKFPDGTVLIKELVSVGSKTASSGEGYFMGEFIGLEAAVKDSKRYPKEPGYWAYFSFGHSYPLAEATKPQKVANCAACHKERAGDDFVFTQYYPVLSHAKGTGMK